MNQTIQKAAKFIIVFLLAILCLTGCTNNFTSPPISFPFLTGENGAKIEADLHIKNKDIYSFSLRYMFDKHKLGDRERVKKLVGSYELDKTGKLLDPGALVLMSLKIKQVRGGNENLIFETESTSQPLYTWGENSFSKKIVEIPLNTGQYRISVQSLKDNPELKDTSIMLSITKSYRGK